MISLNSLSFGLPFIVDGKGMERRTEKHSSHLSTFDNGKKLSGQVSSLKTLIGQFFSRSGIAQSKKKLGPDKNGTECVVSLKPVPFSSIL